MNCGQLCTIFQSLLGLDVMATVSSNIFSIFSNFYQDILKDKVSSLRRRNCCANQVRTKGEVNCFDARCDSTQRVTVFLPELLTAGAAYEATSSPSLVLRRPVRGLLHHLSGPGLRLGQPISGGPRGRTAHSVTARDVDCGHCAAPGLEPAFGLSSFLSFIQKRGPGLPQGHVTRRRLCSA